MFHCFGIFLFLVCALNVLKSEPSSAYVLTTKILLALCHALLTARSSPKNCSRGAESDNIMLAEHFMARKKSLMHSPNQLFASISLLEIITAIPAYSTHQKTVLLPLHDISFHKVDKSWDHLNGVWEVGCTGKITGIPNKYM